MAGAVMGVAEKREVLKSTASWALAFKLSPTDATSILAEEVILSDSLSNML